MAVNLTLASRESSYQDIEDHDGISPEDTKNYAFEAEEPEKRWHPARRHSVPALFRTECTQIRFEELYLLEYLSIAQTNCAEFGFLLLYSYPAANRILRNY